MFTIQINEKKKKNRVHILFIHVSGPEDVFIGFTLGLRLAIIIDRSMFV